MLWLPHGVKERRQAEGERGREGEEKRKKRRGERKRACKWCDYQGKEAGAYKIRGTGTELGLHPNGAHFYLFLHYLIFISRI